MIGQILEYNTVVAKAEFLFMIQSVNLPPSAHTITFSAHCSHVQPFTAICSQPSVHTAANCSHLQPSTSAANTIQCTLQLYYPVHIAATLSGANTIQCIQCTSGSPQGKPIPLLAYLQSSQQTLIQWLNVAVPKMKKTG